MGGSEGSRVCSCRCSSGESSSSASSDRIQVPRHFAMAEFFCAEKPFQGSGKTLAPKERAMAMV